MKHKSLAVVSPTMWRWLVPVAILGALAVSWLVVQTAVAHGDRQRDTKRIVIKSSDEHKAFLGVLMQELTDEVLEGLDTDVKRGVLVTEVIEGSPAEKAGIEEGDIIVEFKGKKVNSPEQLRELVAKEGVGDEVKVKLVRDKRSKTIEVTLGDWADEPAVAWTVPDHRDLHIGDAMKGYLSAFSGKRLGVSVSEINDDLGSYFGVKEGEGLLVLEVHEESTAEGLGVKSGDVIVEVEGEEVRSTGDIREGLSDVDPGDEVNVTVVRKKKKVELKGQLKEGEHVWHYDWRGRGPRVRAFTVPDVDFNDDLRKELDELRKEIEELKKELKKS
jgi:serine protease Do